MSFSDTLARWGARRIGNFERAQLRAFHNRLTGTVDLDAANRIHCKSQVARTRQTAAGQNRVAGSMDPDTTFRIHCKLQVAMTLTEIDLHPGQPRRTDFARRGPWGGWRETTTTTTTEEVPRVLTRRWAVGPANLFTSFEIAADPSWCSLKRLRGSGTLDSREVEIPPSDLRK